MSMHRRVTLIFCLLIVACEGFVVRRPAARSFALYGRRFVEPKIPKTTKRYCTTRAGKTEMIGKLGELLRRTKVLLRFSYRRFTPNERLVLNKSLKPFIRKGADGSAESAKLQMVKNTLMEKAMINTHWEVFAPRMHGPSMCCFIFDDEKIPYILTAVEKLRASNKKIRLHISLESASYAGRVIEPLELFRLATYTSKNELIARLMGAINGGANRIATGLNSIATKLAIALNERAKGENSAAQSQDNVTISTEASLNSS